MIVEIAVSGRSICGYILTRRCIRARVTHPCGCISRTDNLHLFHKGKFGYTKSYAYNETKMLSMMSDAQQVYAMQPMVSRSFFPLSLI